MPNIIWKHNMTFRIGSDSYGVVLYQASGTALVITKKDKNYFMVITLVPTDTVYEENLAIPPDIRLAFDTALLLSSTMTKLFRNLESGSEELTMSL